MPGKPEAEVKALADQKEAAELQNLAPQAKKLFGQLQRTALTKIAQTTNILMVQENLNKEESLNQALARVKQEFVDNFQNDLPERLLNKALDHGYQASRELLSRVVIRQDKENVEAAKPGF